MNKPVSQYENEHLKDQQGSEGRQSQISSRVLHKTESPWINLSIRFKKKLAPYFESYQKPRSYHCISGYYSLKYM